MKLRPVSPQFFFMLLGCFIGMAASPVAALAGSPTLLPPAQAFQITGVQRHGSTIQLDWTIAPEYAIYRDRVKVAPASAGVTVQSVKMPQGVQLDDPSFGLGPGFVHQMPLTVTYHVASTAVNPSLDVTIGGCHHAQPEVCLPPYHVSIPLPRPSSSGYQS